jgi:hypothetical protein
MIEEKDDAEGGDDVIEMIAVVEMTEDREFQQKSENERGGERQDERGEKAAGERIEGDRKIGAKHILHAVREVDEIHHPEHQRQARRNQKQKYAELQTVEDLNYEEGTGHD